MKHIQAPLFFPDPYLSRHISHLTQIFVRRKSMSAEKLLSVLSYVQLLFHLEVSNFPFLSNSRKGHGKLIRRKLLCSPLLTETSNQPSWASFARGRAEITPAGCSLLQNLSCKAQARGSACDNVLAISVQEWQRQAEVHRDRKLLFSCIPAQPFRARPWSQKFHTDKQVNSSNYFLS